MRRLLLAVAMSGTVLAAMPPAEAKSFWLTCGYQDINLDSAKERFSLTSSGKVYQGPAMFSPGQIDFEFKWLDLPDNGGGKYAYSIDRKSLKYTQTYISSVLGGPWEPQTGTATSPNPEFGKCSIMKTPPTAGNQI
jgi:hypothetical protein